MNLNRPAVTNSQMIIGCVITLMLAGMVMIYSNTAVSCGVNPVENAFVVKQTFWMVLALLTMVLFSVIDYHTLTENSHYIMIGTLATLLAILFLATPVNGARRWFRIAGMSLQASEFAKVAIIIYIASFVSRKHEVIGSFVKGLLPPLFVIGITFGLIVIEPDFGTASLIAVVAMVMLIAGGIRLRHVAPFVVAALPLMVFLLRVKEYRWKRLMVFLNPWDDPQGAGYHIVQSLIALGCGGITGVGPGNGFQKLGFLPEAETDFIFATFGQETGFIGCLILIALFTTFVYVGLRVSKAAPDIAGSLLAVGVTVLIGLQMLINVAVAVSAVPTKGISLPFVSFGGSALIALCAGVGILLNVAKHCPREVELRVRGAVKLEELPQ